MSVHLIMDTAYPEIINLSADNAAAFEAVFKTHFKALHAYAYTIVRNDVMAEELVQHVFCRLWEKKEQISINQSVKAYLYRSVYNESLNYLKHLKVKESYQNYAARNMEQGDSATARVSLKELEERLGKALNDLPEQCRTIFQMSRFEELKYRDIAERLGISIKTVENQMGKALRIMRLKLADVLPMLLFLLFHL